MGNTCNNSLSFMYQMVQPDEKITFKGKQFYIKSKLGEGGFATVYLVQDISSKRLYAMKKIICLDEHSRSIGNLELEMLQKFKHPNILKLYDYSIIQSKEDPDRVEINLLLQYFPKGSLQDYIENLEKDKFFLNEKAILKMFLTACQAVYVLHQNDPPLAHRDIKPHNFLLDKENKLTLCDFGSVTTARKMVNSRRDLLDLIEDSEKYCTPSYRAPELWDRGLDDDLTIDERIDVWGLGCVLYALSFHENPFDQVVLRGGIVKLAIIEGKLEFPKYHPYSESFLDFIKFILNPNPQKRPFLNEVIDEIKMRIEQEEN